MLPANGFISRELDSLKEKIFSRAEGLGCTPQSTDRAFSAVWSQFAPARETTFRIAAGALMQHRPIQFTYQSPQADQPAWRTAEPHHMLHYRGSWILIAWCLDRRDWRRFYLARMTRLKVIDPPFTPRPECQWRPLLENAFGLFQGAKTISVTLCFSPFRARWVREQHWHPRQVIIEEPDGGLTLTLPVADFREIKMIILQFGADCEVIAPQALREEVQVEITKMASVYEAEKGKLKIKSKKKATSDVGCPIAFDMDDNA
jgi:predicted DNA-binding transcriptional regulator YafY